ncbi:hypothetical protein DL93DRAFT_2087822 [Clavulina sp. PMI_390]|nr:hypothetical protein DL93DRAFT_2087822 [Clavulina sp. PMI_390]
MEGAPKKPEFFALYSDEAFQAEVEKGNITQEDVDTLNALSARTRVYRNIGLYGGATAAAYYARFNRKPPWSFPKSAFFAGVSSIAGLALSSVAVAASLYKSFANFQDKDRFKLAIENLRAGRAAQQGLPWPPPMRGSPQPAGQFGAESSAQSNSGWSSTANVDGSSYDTPDASSSSEASSDPNSRWNEIRAANNAARTSTWDRIREARAKADLPNQQPSSSSGYPSTSTPSSYPPPPQPPAPAKGAGSDALFSGIPMPRPNPAAGPRRTSGVEGELGAGTEVMDKEKFEALLDAERNFGQEQQKKEQSRWS